MSLIEQGGGGDPGVKGLGAENYDLQGVLCMCVCVCVCEKQRIGAGSISVISMQHMKGKLEAYVVDRLGEGRGREGVVGGGGGVGG